MPRAVHIFAQTFLTSGGTNVWSRLDGAGTTGMAQAETRATLGESIEAFCRGIRGGIGPIERIRFAVKTLITSS